MWHKRRKDSAFKRKRLIADETSPSKSCDYSGTLAPRVSLEALDRLSIATERVSHHVTHND